MKMEIELCTAAGINIRNMELLDVYLTARKILNNTPLRLHAVDFLNGMTPDERRTLRERLTGVVLFKR